LKEFFSDLRFGCGGDLPLFSIVTENGDGIGIHAKSGFGVVL
jgi:hypothetical protein